MYYYIIVLLYYYIILLLYYCIIILLYHYFFNYYLILLFYIITLINIYINKLTNFFNIINLLGFLLILQIILGIFTLLYGAQIVLSSMHQINSIFLVSVSIYFLYLNTNTTN